MIQRLPFATAIFLIVLQATAQTSISGKYQTTGVPNGPWIIELQANGNRLTGNVRQGGASGEPVPIYFGSIEGNNITFKVNSPDGDRIITFSGKITRPEIGFNRWIEIRPGGVRGDTGVFGANGVLNFSAKRMN